MVQEFDCFWAKRGGFKKFLDVGANHGIYSLAFSFGRPETRVLAIEPSPLAFPILLENIARNGAKNIDSLQIAAAARKETLRMKVNWHHVEALPEEQEAEPADVLRIPAEPLDAICRAKQFTPDLIKVDVEGFELPCLKGLTETIRAAKPTIFLEIHPQLTKALGYGCEAITRLVRELGYRFEALTGEGLTSTFVEEQIHTTWVILVPDSAANC